MYKKKHVEVDQQQKNNNGEGPTYKIEYVQGEGGQHIKYHMWRATISIFLMHKVFYVSDFFVIKFT